MHARSFGARCLRMAAGGLAQILLALPAQAAADRAVSPPCAARDLAAVTLIEQQGEPQTMASERLAHATMTMMLAREVCAAGRLDEALAVYDGIIDSLGPMLSQRAR